MEDIPVCTECGYELAGLSEDPPGSVRCPECSVMCDLASAPRLRPWQSPASLARWLCLPFAVNVLALMLLMLGMWLWGAPTREWVRLPVAILFIALMAGLPLTGLAHPGSAAARLAHQHAPRARKASAFLKVAGAAVGVNLVVLTIGVIAAYFMDAW